MRRSHLKHYLSILLLFIGISHSIQSNQTNTQKYIVKVLIGEHEHTNRPTHPTWRITSQTGFLVYNPECSIEWHSIRNNTITITHKNNGVFINGAQYKGSQLRIMPKDGYAGIDDAQFHGSLSLILEKDRTYLVNHVDLEEYVYSVLKTESWPGWPIEVNKAFAISSRSYVVALIQQMQNTRRPYHVKNTNEHQTYQGMHTTNSIRAAVEQTKGMILVHNNEPALTMFDSCCGGIIPAHIEDVDFEKAPYLARTYPCTHCSRCKIYSWEKVIHLGDINKQIKQIVEFPGLVHNVTIAEKDKAGLVSKLHLKNGKETHAISGKQFYGALKDIKSFCYTVTRKADKLLFSGKGYGHHLGMCQWGAREMVRDGWHFKRILAFYYPETKIKKVV